MAYATLDDLLALQPQSVLLQLTDDDDDGGFVRRQRRPNAALRNVESAISEAAAVVDAYIGGRYRVPIGDPVPNIVTQITANLALCLLYDRRRELDAPKGIEERRERCMSLLRDIREDKASIIGAPVPLSTAALCSAPPREFSRPLLGAM